MKSRPSLSDVSCVSVSSRCPCCRDVVPESTKVVVGVRVVVLLEAISSFEFLELSAFVACLLFLHKAEFATGVTRTTFGLFLPK
mmetsp:Transcript_91337/g.293346  ORF Transcript_91337/g.293346 Transcript_91337/m.293346 type:complete len:84 (+) Transcript_91337:895-1146(+)